MWGVISLWFWFAFPWWLVILSTFSCICWPSVCLLWEKMSIQIICLFFNQILWGFFFCYWIWILYIFWLLTPYEIIWFANIFSHLVGYLFILLIISFAVQKLFNLRWSHLFLLSDLKNHCQNQCQGVYSLCFFSKLYGTRSYFQVFYSFWDNLCVFGIIWWSRFILLMWLSSFPNVAIKETILFHCKFLALLS